MTETTSPTLSGVAETLLLPLYIRALESQRPDARQRRKGRRLGQANGL